MSSTANNDGTGTDAEKPVQDAKMVFPPFPAPTEEDFEDDLTEEEKKYYREKYPDVNTVVKEKLHCTACDRHLGCAAKNDSRMRCHPMLKTLMCHTCYSFYNSGEFEKGDDGSELYCRWCGQGGQVYCCSDCPVVFCAKCIKRNLGVSKIKHIEATDDWKCFKCDSKCLWDLRATCWALLRYCDLKNKITACTVDIQLKSLYEKDCGKDFTECCKNKYKRKEKTEEKEREKRKKEVKEENKDDVKKSVSSIITKIPPSIQVKKFAHINNSSLESPKEKKAAKRSASPKNKVLPLYGMIRTGAGPMPIMPVPPPAKKVRMPTMSVLNPIRVQNPRSLKPNNVMQSVYIPNNTQYNINNGYPSPIFNNSLMTNDNINLSLESLTQGTQKEELVTVTQPLLRLRRCGYSPNEIPKIMEHLKITCKGLNMSAVSQMSQSSGMDIMDNDVVCTPDFPLEPLCEVTEDNTDDDVECITPTPTSSSKKNTITPKTNKLPEFSSDNIVQMTENDVTINAATGGLKFRVDPQTLSSNKMYRLPDGRVFAINVNPNMPGGYSATIVAVTESKTGKIVPKGSTFSAKLSSINSNSGSNKPAVSKPRKTYPKRKPEKPSKPSSKQRECDLTISVEWFRYNLIDAVDSLEYSLKRLQNLKKEASTMFLRSRTMAEMRDLHKHFDRLLNTSSTRFNEIREQLNKEMKKFVSKKTGSIISDDDDDDDDDVEILNDVNEDPIFIDENSLDSHVDKNDNGDIDLTSDANDSGEKTVNQNEVTNMSTDDLNCTEQTPVSEEDQSPKRKTSGNDNSENIEQEKDKTSDGKENDEETKTQKDDDSTPQQNDETEASKQNNDEDETSQQNNDEDETSQNNENAASQQKEKEVRPEVDENNDESNDVTRDDVDGNDEAQKTNSNDTEENNVTEERLEDEVMDNGDDDHEVKKELLGEQHGDEHDDSAEKDKDKTDTQATVQENDDAIDDKSQENEDAIDDKSQDTEMTEDMIENLLKDATENDLDESAMSCMDIPDFQVP